MMHRTISTNLGYMMGASRSGKMSLPVAPANYIYSQFKHVSGVPAPEGVRGVAVNKLKILDVLIEQLGKIKKRGEPTIGPMSEERIDALIEQYEAQIRQTSAVGLAMPYKAVPTPPVGMLFDLAA